MAPGESIHAGESVRRLRERRGLSVERLAVRLGTSPAHVRSVEAGDAPVDLDTVRLVLGDPPASVRRDYDVTDRREAQRRTPSQRLGDAITVNTFADRLAGAAKDVDARA